MKFNFQHQLICPLVSSASALLSSVRPDDFLSCLMDDAVEDEKNPRNLTVRILAVNFAEIHTTSIVSHFLLPYIWLACEDLHVYSLPVACPVSHALRVLTTLMVYISPECIQP